MKIKSFFVPVFCAFLCSSAFSVQLGLRTTANIDSYPDSKFRRLGIASAMGIGGLLYAKSAAFDSMKLIRTTSLAYSFPSFVILSTFSFMGLAAVGGAAPVEPPEDFLCPSSRKLKEQETEESYSQKSFNINDWLASDPLGLVTDIGYLRGNSEFVFEHQPDFVNSSLVADSGVADSYATVSLNQGDNLYHIKGSMTQLIELDKVPFSEHVFLKRQSAYLLQQGQDSVKLLYINKYHQPTVCSY